ncbi:hypothetical protein LI036_09225 [bacterium 210917-DFI.7.65]|nr:hypothetical protein [bacterium 210917-DFI.7.65]
MQRFESGKKAKKTLFSREISTWGLLRRAGVPEENSMAVGAKQTTRYCVLCCAADLGESERKSCPKYRKKCVKSTRYPENCSGFVAIYKKCGIFLFVLGGPEMA